MAGLPQAAGSLQAQQWETVRLTDSDNEAASLEEETVSESGDDDDDDADYNDTGEDRQSMDASGHSAGAAEANADGITGRYLFNAGVLGTAVCACSHAPLFSIASSSF